MISYNQAVQVIRSFADAHWQIKKFGAEFKEQMPNIATITEQYPLLFICPLSSSTNLNTNEFEVEVYCLDRLMQDRENSMSIISDTQLILADLARWLEDGQEDLEVVKLYTSTPINNDLLDYCSGWVMRVRFEVERIGLCEIPMDEVTPIPGGACDPATYIIYDTDNNELYSGSVASGGFLQQTIQDSTVSNSDDSYTNSVLAEGNLELADTTYNIYLDGTLEESVSIPTLKNETLNINL